MTTNGNTEFPGPPDAENFIRNIVREELTHFLQAEIRPVLADISKEVVTRLPDKESIVREVLGQLREQTEGVSRGGLVTPALPSDTGGNLGSVLTTILPAIEAVFDRSFKMWMEYQDLQIRKRNPFEFARYLSEHSPLEARFIGSMLAPDPMSSQIPGMLADATTSSWVSATRAIQRAMVQTGWQPPGNFTPGEPFPLQGKTAPLGPPAGYSGPDNAVPSVPDAGKNPGPPVSLQAVPNLWGRMR